MVSTLLRLLSTWNKADYKCADVDLDLIYWMAHLNDLKSMPSAWSHWSVRMSPSTMVGTKCVWE